MNYDLDSAAKKLGLGAETLRMHINSFYMEFRNNEESIRKALVSGDYDRIYFEFHRLKSTFKMISASEAEALCRECCHLSGEEVPHDYLSALASIRKQLEEICNQIL